MVGREHEPVGAVVSKNLKFDSGFSAGSTDGLDEKKMGSSWKQ